MGIGLFFRHTCNVFSSISTPIPPSYGLKISDTSISYNDSPEMNNCPCFFGSSNTAPKITFSEPINTYDGHDEVSLPVGTNIKKGDKIVDLRNNIEYTAGFPEDIRGKYISVPLYRKAEQERL